jgi:hypothetical protein
MGGLNRGKQLILENFIEDELIAAVGECVERLDAISTSVEAFQHPREIKLWVEAPRHFRTAHRFNDLEIDGI